MCYLVFRVIKMAGTDIISSSSGSSSSKKEGVSSARKERQ
ncbi:WSSV312 [White spot syndrome virus]|uniref:WSSV312 n=1 Tax=White spot syndrome virus TaxID=342409 RepID=A0A2I6SC32_9VIRU|nr:WSSV312 [White spot syndrome virus]